MGGKISDLTNPKKKMVALDIQSRWSKDIIKEGERKVGSRVMIYCLTLPLLMCN